MKYYIIMMMYTCVVVSSVAIGKNHNLDGFINTQLQKLLDKRTFNFNKTTNNTGNSEHSEEYINYNVSQTIEHRIESQSNNTKLLFNKGRDKRFNDSHSKDGQIIKPTVTKDFNTSTVKSEIKVQEIETGDSIDNVTIIPITNEARQKPYFSDVKEYNDSKSLSALKNTTGVKIYSDPKSNIVTTTSFAKASVVTPTEGKSRLSSSVNKTERETHPNESRIVTRIFEHNKQSPFTAVSKQKSTNDKVTKILGLDTVFNTNKNIFPTSPTITSMDISSSVKDISNRDADIMSTLTTSGNAIFPSNSKINTSVAPGRNDTPTTFDNSMLSSERYLKNTKSDVISTTVSTLTTSGNDIIPSNSTINTTVAPGRNDTPTTFDNPMLSSESYLKNTKSDVISTTANISLQTTSGNDIIPSNSKINTSVAPGRNDTPTTFVNPLLSSENNLKNTKSDVISTTALPNINIIFSTSTVENKEVRTDSNIVMPKNSASTPGELGTTLSQGESASTLPTTILIIKHNASEMKNVDNKDISTSKSFTTTTDSENMVPTSDAFRTTLLMKIITSETGSDLKSVNTHEITNTGISTISTTPISHTTLTDSENVIPTSDTFQTSLPMGTVTSESDSNLKPIFSTGSSSQLSSENVIPTTGVLPSTEETDIGLTTDLSINPTSLERIRTLPDLANVLPTSDTFQTTIPMKIITFQPNGNLESVNSTQGFTKFSLFETVSSTSDSLPTLTKGTTEIDSTTDEYISSRTEMKHTDTVHMKGTAVNTTKVESVILSPKRMDTTPSTTSPVTKHAETTNKANINIRDANGTTITPKEIKNNDTVQIIGSTENTAEFETTIPSVKRMNTTPLTKTATPVTISETKHAETTNKASINIRDANDTTITLKNNDKVQIIGSTRNTTEFETTIPSVKKTNTTPLTTSPVTKHAETTNKANINIRDSNGTTITLKEIKNNDIVQIIGNTENTTEFETTIPSVKRTNTTPLTKTTTPVTISETKHAETTNGANMNNRNTNNINQTLGNVAITKSELHNTISTKGMMVKPTKLGNIISATKMSSQSKIIFSKTKPTVSSSHLTQLTLKPTDLRNETESFKLKTTSTSWDTTTPTSKAKNTASKAITSTYNATHIPSKTTITPSKATTATSKATTATSKATTATPKATTATSKAIFTTSKATTATSKATTPTSKANIVTSKAITTTLKATITPSKATTATSKATTATPNATITPSKATITTSKATTATSKATTLTSKAKIAASKAITTTLKATITPSKATTATSKATFTTSKATTATSKATTATSKAIITPSKATTATSKATTATSKATTATSKAIITTTKATITPSRATTTTPKATTTTSKAANLRPKTKISTSTKTITSKQTTITSKATTATSKASTTTLKITTSKATTPTSKTIFSTLNTTTKTSKSPTTTFKAKTGTSEAKNGTSKATIAMSTPTTLTLNTKTSTSKTTTGISTTITSSSKATNRRFKVTNNVKTNSKTTTRHQTLKPSKTQSTTKATVKMNKVTNTAGQSTSQLRNLTTDDLESLSASYVIQTKSSNSTVLTTTSGSLPEHDKLHVESADDKYWPLVMVLAVGIPTIIVIGVTICVIHNRRLARPSRSRFRRSSRLA